MQKLNVLQAQSMKVVQANGSYGYLPDAVKTVAKQFEFKGLPTDNEIVAVQQQTDPNAQAKPLTFAQGKIALDGRVIAIDSFQIYPYGLLVQTRTDTDDADRVVRYALDWASKNFPITYDELRPSFGHWSTIDFKFTRPLPEFFPLLTKLAQLLTDKLDAFWAPSPTFELTSFGFFYDKGKYPVFSPPAFRIDRRLNQPFERHIYWSEAPLSTANHVRLLEEFEELFVA